MQQIRQLSDAGPLHDLEIRIDNAQTHFISYRHKDGIVPAFEKCSELVEAGHAVWWDRWSLPRRLAERREDVSERALDRRIRQQLLDADVVWGIETKHYEERKSYAAKEKRLALKNGTYRPVSVSS